MGDVPTPEDNALQAVRNRHELRVLESLVTHGNRTRRELQSDTSLSRTTLSAIIGDLRQRGILSENDQLFHNGTRNGRPTKVLSLNPDAGAAVGIELGRRRVSVSVTGFDGSAVAHEQRIVSTSLALDAKVQLAADIIDGLVTSGRILPERMIGIGVGIASRHANPASLADGAEQQEDPEGASLAPLRAKLPAPLLWDNNIRLAAMSYSQNDDDEFLYVVLSAGVSSAIVTKGSLMRGGHGIAGELGHISVDFAGPNCWCGRQGCLESYINEANVLVEAAHRGQSFPTIVALAEAAIAGNDVAQGMIKWAGELLARAIVGACVLIDPSRVVIAGELSQLGEELLVPVRNALAEQHLGLGQRSTKVSIAPYAPTAGSDGAARMALKHWALTRLA